MKDIEKTEFHTVRGYQLLEQNDRLLTSSMEDYLEMISRHSKEVGFIRINTLAELLNVKASSATKMVQKLSESGFLDYEKYGIIFLTEKGKILGDYLLERHKIIENFLKTIGIKANALVETELIEHNISEDTLKNINHLVNFFLENPEVLSYFRRYKREQEELTEQNNKK